MTTITATRRSPEASQSVSHGREADGPAIEGVGPSWLAKRARTSLLHERLYEAVACLERLDLERIASGDPTFGKTIEERVVSRELLDLELQNFDEEGERLSGVAQSLRTREMVGN